MAGWVLVNGQKALKPSQKITPDKVQIDILKKPKYVSRGGEKLESALNAFPIEIKNKTAADLGASTGGFTDCLLQHQARKVYAVDVGYGQLDFQLRKNPKVLTIEKQNARYLKREDFDDPVDLITADLSFISLKKVLPAIAEILIPGGETILLIKPQFEAKRSEVKKGGVVKDKEVHDRVIQEIRDEAEKVGLKPFGSVPSSIKGPSGNQEYLLYCRKEADK